MTPVDLALLIALSVTGGALIAVGTFHDWRLRILERDLWGNPDHGRRPLPPRSTTAVHADEPPSAPPTPVREQIRIAELRLEQAKEALDRLRRQAP